MKTEKNKNRNKSRTKSITKNKNTINTAIILYQYNLV